MPKLHSKKPSNQRRNAQTSVFSLLLITVAVTTLVVIPFVFDSFTTTKLFVLSLGISIVLIGLMRNEQIILNKLERPIYFTSVLFMISIFVSWTESEVPFTRGMTGQFGRGNGVIYYLLAIALLVLTGLLFKDIDGPLFHKFLTILAWTLCSYALLQKSGINLAQLDTKGLSPVVLTFGNSNFAGSMLAVLFAYHLTYSFIIPKLKIPQLTLLASLLVCVTFPAAVQGYLIILFALALGLSMFAYNNFRSRRTGILLLFFWAVSSVLMVLGALGNLIFASIFSRSTFQIRIEYWKIAFNVFKEQPWFGVGPDKLFDYSSKYMAPGSLDLISATRLDNAHNWYLNVMANFGLFSFILFLILILYLSFRSVQLIFTSQKVSVWGRSSAIAFLSVLLSGIVSIEQPGIGIWLYFFGGIVTAAHAEMVLATNPNNSSKSSWSLQLNSIKIISSLALVICAVFVVLLGNRILLDAKLRSNIQSLIVGEGNVQSVSELENLGKKLRSEPEYAVKALDVLSRIGASKEIDAVSEATYEYAPDSIQAALIRAEVLRALGREEEACSMRSRLLVNSPWDIGQLEEYLVCISNGLKEPESKELLKTASAYFRPFSYKEVELNYKDSESFQESISLVQQLIRESGILARLNYELGNLSDAKQLAQFARLNQDRLKNVLDEYPAIRDNIKLIDVTSLISLGK